MHRDRGCFWTALLFLLSFVYFFSPLPGFMAVCHLNIARSCVTCRYCVCIAACSLIGNVNRRSMPVPCSISSRFYILVFFVKQDSTLFLLLWTLRDTFKLNFVTFYGNQMGCFQSNTLQTTRTHTITRRVGRVPVTEKPEETEHSVDQTRDQRPERLISILLPVNSRNLLSSPSRR